MLLKSYGWLSSMHPLAKLVASPIFGYLYQRTKSLRMLSLLTSCLQIFGSILYAILPGLQETYRLPLMMLSRIITGLGSAIGACLYSYIATATFESERTCELSKLLGFQVFGLLIGPAIQAALTTLTCANLTSSGLAFNMHSSVG